MNERFTEELNKKYPDISPKIFSCDDGWFDIISTVFAVCQNRSRHKSINFKFVQIKEKFGGLRMYGEGADEFIFGVITCAESLSYKTCEVTGRPGFLCIRGSWFKTLCEEKMIELGYEKYKKTEG